MYALDAQTDLQVIDGLDLYLAKYKSFSVSTTLKEVWSGVVADAVFLVRSLSVHWPCTGSLRGQNLAFVFLSVVRLVSLSISSE